MFTDPNKILISDGSPDDPLCSRPVEILLEAYRHGFFPMVMGAEEFTRATGIPWEGSGPISWWCPEVRGVMPMTEAEGLHVSRRLAERMRAGRFVFTSDQCFVDVMRQCARPRKGEDGTWIDERLVEAYGAMFDAGHAHSIEAWAPRERENGSEWLAGIPDVVERQIAGRAMVLVGGLYGVHLGAAFFAESKFHRADLGGTDASKMCLITLVRHLHQQGFHICDTQMWNAHIGRLGCREMPRAEFLPKLRAALAASAAWGQLGVR